MNQSVLFNQNATIEAFPLFYNGVSVSGTTLGQNEFASVHALASVRILFDGLPVLTDVDGLLTVPDPFAFNPASSPLFTVFTVPLPPGLHSLVIGAHAEGFASAAPTPEPTTLLLFGTTAAGLGLARWYRRRARGRAYGA